MYYRLDVDLGRMNTRVQTASNEGTSLCSGLLIEEGGLELPFRCEMLVDPDLLEAHGEEDVDEVEEEEDDDGENEGGEAPLFYSFYPSACVMTKQMVAALERAGVDNLQTFPATVECAQLNRTFDEYLAVNIVGLVACADRQLSRSEPLADLQFFHELVIDSNRAHGLRLFRLAESRIDVIVDESVAAALTDAGLVGLSLQPCSR